MNVRRSRAAAVSLLMATSCVGWVGDPPSHPDALLAPPDGGRSEDAGSPQDAGRADAGLDAGLVSGFDSGVDAGMDAGVDAGVDAGLPDRSCGAQLICDDFESGTAANPAPNWSTLIYPSASSGSITLDTQRAFSGTRSLHLSSSESGAYVQIVRSLTLLPTNAFFGRMNIFFDAWPKPKEHWDLIQGWGYVPGSVSRPVSDQIQYSYGGGIDNTLAGYYLSNTRDCGQYSAAQMPIGRWACLEWQFDGVNDEMRIWIDGQAIDPLTMTNPTSSTYASCAPPWVASAPIFERLSLGFYRGSPVDGGTIDMWIDDVAIDSQRVGCLP
jgi:hypothetical protein